MLTISISLQVLCASLLAFAALSTNPELAKKIHTFYALAPAAFAQYAITPLRKISLIPVPVLRVSDSLWLNLWNETECKFQSNEKDQNNPSASCFSTSRELFDSSTLLDISIYFFAFDYFIWIGSACVSSEMFHLSDFIH